MKKHSGCLGHFCTAQISHIISVVGMSTYSTQIEVVIVQSLSYILLLMVPEQV
jgi:hypothetical protein